ncbi:hypothetical protein [Paraburkholderia tropica]|uniref:hypothetical protein n=1 Tax=Paraburkholderia tropica TaxID=92647 RepID=UPI002AB71676|nr:hypothetical protein [Paraburkholderia tropica]
MKSVFGFIGIAAAGASLGPFGWLIWFVWRGGPWSILNYQLLVAGLTALLVGVTAFWVEALRGQAASLKGAGAVSTHRKEPA